MGWFWSKLPLSQEVREILPIARRGGSSSLLTSLLGLRLCSRIIFGKDIGGDELRTLLDSAQVRSLSWETSLNQAIPPGEALKAASGLMRRLGHMELCSVHLLEIFLDTEVVRRLVRILLDVAVQLKMVSFPKLTEAHDFLRREGIGDAQKFSDRLAQEVERHVRSYLRHPWYPFDLSDYQRAKDALQKDPRGQELWGEYLRFSAIANG